MSGHSKWATIKHKKGAADAKRGKLFAKLIRQVEVAARNHLLKLEGYHAAQEFQKRLMERIADADMDLDLDIEESE